MISKPKLFAEVCWPIAENFANIFGYKNKCFFRSHLKTLPYHIILKRNITSHASLFCNFSTLEARKSLNHPSLQRTQYYDVLLKNNSRTFMSEPNREIPKKRNKRIPKLILLQNPFRWIMIKIDFNVLRRVWDPEFQEKEFRFGTRQAISRVTQLISEGHYSELNGLLTKAARYSLIRELDRNWNEKQRSLIALNRDDIQISSPRKVYFIRIGEKKFCDVDMAFLALKWASINSTDMLLFAEIFARFHREYTPQSIPQWTIAYFKVTRFEVLRR